jgi:predicted DNA binding CopG/RHH family protein
VEAHLSQEEEVINKEKAEADIREWWMTPADQRTTKKRLLKKTGIVDIRTLNKKIEEVKGNGTDKLIDQLASLDEIHIEQFFTRVYERAMEPKATAKHMELYAKLKGLLIEKRENVNIDLSGDDIFAIREKARRELEEGGFLDRGAGEVSDKPIILPSEIREDTG